MFCFVVVVFSDFSIGTTQNVCHLGGFTIFVNNCFSLATCVKDRDDIDTYDWHVYVLFGSFDTSLLLFLKGHVDKPANSGGMFKHI